MNLQKRLRCGPLSAVLFVVGTLGIALFLPGYSHVREDVSTIAALGTPTRVPFAILVYCVAGCLLLFASALREVASRNGLPQLGAYLIAFVVLSEVGIATFATPHPLHEPFGLLSLVGYQAPGVLAFTWRRDVKLRTVVIASWLFFFGLWAATALILVPGFWPVLARLLEPIAGLIQRTLFVAWFGWCAFVGIALNRHRQPI
jgi:Protein of unknown function (DUF998)